MTTGCQWHKPGCPTASMLGICIGHVQAASANVVEHCNKNAVVCFSHTHLRHLKHVGIWPGSAARMRCGLCNHRCGLSAGCKDVSVNCIDAIDCITSRPVLVCQLIQRFAWADSLGLILFKFEFFTALVILPQSNMLCRKHRLRA